jgi:hypothetical protein
VKCYHVGGITITLVQRNSSLGNLQEAISKLFGTPMKVQWLDDDDETVDIADQADLDLIFSQVKDSTLRLAVSRQKLESDSQSSSNY